MEKKVKAEWFLIHLVCDKCKTGVMFYNGKALNLGNGPRLEHECKSCGHKVSTDKPYPGRVMAEMVDDKGNPIEVPMEKAIEEAEIEEKKVDNKKVN